MRRVALRVGTVVVAVVLSLISTALAAGAASATEPCRLNMVWAGRVGEVNASLAPNGFVQWGARKDLRSGQVLRFLVYHVDTNGNKSVSRPDASCLIP